MPTLEEMCAEYGITTDEDQEKIASAQDSEATQLAGELGQEEGNQDETNLDGGDNMGLQDLYNEVFEDELEKVAEVEGQEQTQEEMEKVAEDYVAAGRFLARGFYDELEKIAAIPSQGTDSEKIPPQLSAEGDGYQINDDSKLAVNTTEAKNANKDALKEKYVNAMLNKKKGVQSDGNVGEDHKVAPDAAKK